MGASELTLLMIMIGCDHCFSIYPSTNGITKSSSLRTQMLYAFSYSVRHHAFGQAGRGRNSRKLVEVTNAIPLY
ncbi:uncharacterized protein EDB93DRAFT_1168699 [Suillus bovinus]|uniref:uncharacterized protein n=1 Tax=Suillus bovinus TaxID=48563 RepID=UPI001B863871|nr:uncharacterized protein EDB93DRAFT_1168699 [Suillus bovinus]KAG2136618.1 hypothetical protein EDB93DRAFT_1168699 [Suillus bovinus]